MTYLTTDARDGVRLAAPGAHTTIAVAPSEPPAVLRAVEDLAQDLAKVCAGALVEISERPDSVQLVVGTIGVSPLIDAAIAAGDLDIDGLRAADGSPVWEGFTIQTVGQCIYLAGTDRRGSIYGIYDLCEKMGVSPWWWFGDVPVRSRAHVTVRRGTSFSDRPSVKYRGIFINDEEELDNWSRAHTADDTIGPETYARIFELVLRLKGNYVWPAMHVNAFNHDLENGRLADAMGIVIGTSHCDMLLRSNVHEFTPWEAAQPEPVVYDYSVTGRNQEKVREYWRESVVQNGAYDVTWTVGMRGIHDSGFATAAIDADETLTSADKVSAKVALLQQVIADQRSLLTEVLGDRGQHSPQIFVPYKEVLPLYDAGLDLPDDITVVWANDSFGYIRRFPSEQERTRSGGHGVYYHSSYWSEPPRSYLGTSSTPLALMQNELRKAWQRGIRTLWVNNIGGLKPLELELEFFLRLAWNADRETATEDVGDFVGQWVDATFSGHHGDRAGRLYARYYQLNNQRKAEHLDSRVFSQTAYGDESVRRITELRGLFDDTNEILTALPAEERDAFFQLFAVKIHMAYLVGAHFAYADRSLLAYRQGRYSAADAYLELSRAFEKSKRALLHSYNHVISGGKWRLMLTPEEAPPPTMAMHPVGRPALQIGDPGLGVAVWGEDLPNDTPQLTFWPYGIQTKWIDVFTTGAPGLSFTVTADDWLEVSDVAGTLSHDRRISVRLADPVAAAGRQGTVIIAAGGRQVRVAVEVAAPLPAPSRFTGSIEADGYLSLDAGLPDAVLPTAESTWQPVNWLGRDGHAVLEVRGGAGATAEYRVYLVTPGEHLLELHRLPTLNAPGRIRVAVGIDDQYPVTVESPITDEHRGGWAEAVLDNVERLSLQLPCLEAGEHVIRLHAIDDDVAISKLVVHTAPRDFTNLGPRFSHHTERPLVDSADRDPACTSLSHLAAVAEEIYRTDPAEVPLPAALFAGAGSAEWRRCIAIPQTQLGAPRQRTRPNGTKDVLADLAAIPAFSVNGSVRIDAEAVLAGTANAWLTAGSDDSVWSHLNAETDAGTGLAMWVDAPGQTWSGPHQAPGLHYALDVRQPGRYSVWLLVKFNHQRDDACWLAVDDVPVQPAHQLFGWDVSQRWHWTVLGEIELTAGAHILSVLAHEAGLRIDRIYLSTGDELPPTDKDWR